MIDRYERERRFHNVPVTERWRSVEKYYTITSISQGYYESSILANCGGKDILEYGCGEGSSAFLLARSGATVTGIDLSEFRIGRARHEARAQGLDNLSLLVMNAEDLQFPDSSFDVICGTGILHHLDLDVALSELARTLRPDGRAIFLEPLGHNPLIRAYRRRTPGFRTADEHPLLMKDIDHFTTYFGAIETRFFHLATLAAVPFRKMRFFPRLVAALESFDRGLFRFAPVMRRYAWTTVFSLAMPRKAAGGTEAPAQLGVGAGR
jgi:SAM-dependent methyltransferase